METVTSSMHVGGEKISLPKPFLYSWGSENDVCQGHRSCSSQSDTPGSLPTQSPSSFRDNSEDGLESIRRVKGNDWQTAGLGRGPAIHFRAGLPERVHTACIDQEPPASVSQTLSFTPRTTGHWPLLDFLAMLRVSPLLQGRHVLSPRERVQTGHWNARSCPVPGSRTPAGKTKSYGVSLLSTTAADVYCMSWAVELPPVGLWQHFKVRIFFQKQINKAASRSSSCPQKACHVPPLLHPSCCPTPLWELS